MSDTREKAVKALADYMGVKPHEVPDRVIDENHSPFSVHKALGIVYAAALPPVPVSTDVTELIAEIRFHQQEWEHIYGKPNYAPNLALAVHAADALEFLSAPGRNEGPTS